MNPFLRNTFSTCALLALGLGVSLPRVLADDAAPSSSDQSAPAASGDQTPPPEHKGSKVLDQLKDKLNLTDDQVDQVKDVMKDLGKQMRDLRDDDSLSDDDRAAKMKDLRQQMHDKINAVLTPDQQKIFATMPMPGAGHHKKSADGDAPSSPPAN